jgi:hypothetical protein
MYRTCIHCQRDLGRNALLEQLPIRRRVAFDAARGRLWVICRACARWNLVPFDDRFEAIEAAERTFRSTTLRKSTDEIGLAQTREGTQLIRIGRPQRPEIAAWRYGSELTDRRRAFVFVGAPLAAVAGFAAYGGDTLLSLLGASLPAVMSAAPLVAASGLLWRDWRVRARIQIADGATLKVSRNHLRAVALMHRDDGLSGLQVSVPIPQRQYDAVAALVRQLKHQDLAVLSYSHLIMRGERVDAVLRQALPFVNEAGASHSDLNHSLALLDTHGVELTALLAPQAMNSTGPLTVMTRTRRLALEMALHESAETHWLGGELASLEARWRDAEEIAGIADALVQSSHIEARLAQLKEQAERD